MLVSGNVRLGTDLLLSGQPRARRLRMEFEVETKLKFRENSPAEVYSLERGTDPPNKKKKKKIREKHFIH